MKKTIISICLLTLFTISLIAQPNLNSGANLPDNIKPDVNCFTDPPQLVWGIKSIWSSDKIVSNLIIPMVGDLDGDGIPEIVCFGREGRIMSRDDYAPASPTILVYDGATHALKCKIRMSSYVSEYDAAGYGLVKTKDKKGLIVVACLDNKLRAYDITSADPNIPYWISDIDFGTQLGDFAVNVGFADFNQDGYPEIYIRNKIYDATTGKLLAIATGGSNAGLSWAHFTHLTVKYPWKLSSPAAADIDNDGKLELILGNEIYKVNITNREGMSGNSIVRYQTIVPPSGVIADGHAQAVDFNKDGYLDILITNRNSAGYTGNVSMYVWDVHNNKVSAPVILETNMSGKSFPLIADVDNDKNLEVIIQCAVSGSNEKVRCYKYDAINMTWSYFWGFVPDEDSYSNTCTLFDFNLDGKNEVLLTDQSRICIIDGSRSPVTLMTVLYFGETTIMQYPIIADVDADGSAEIIAVGLKNGARESDGTLNIFKSSTTPWAPARKVWNQYMYNAVNVNEDLTIPAKQYNSAVRFPGKDGVLGTNDDVWPFNNFFQQQTVLNKYGTPLWLAANAQFSSQPKYEYDRINDKMKITLGITNVGDNPFRNSFYITVYKDKILNSPKQFTYKYEGSINRKDTIETSFTLNNFATDWNPNSGIIINLNDKGDGKHDQDVCGDAFPIYYYTVIPTSQDDCSDLVDKNLTCPYAADGSTFQWQMSKDRGCSWSDITGATGREYTTNQTRGTVFYRVKVKLPNRDEAYSDVVKFKMRSCQLPVNHNISVMEYE